MAIVITPDEIRNYGVEAEDKEINQIIADAVDQAEMIAPGLSLLEGQEARSVAAVIRGAVARFLSVGGDGVTAEMNAAGPFTQQRSYQSRSTLFLPSEERKLIGAAQSGKRRAFAIDLAPDVPAHDCGICVNDCLRCYW